MRRKASSWSAGSMPRPSPLKKHGTRELLGGRAELAPRRRPSRRRCRRGRPVARRRAISVASAATASGSGRRRRISAGAVGDVACGRGPNTSSGKSRNTGPRCGVSAEPDGVVDDCAPAVEASVDGAGRLGDRGDDRHVVELLQRARPQRRCGARPPSTTSGEPLNMRRRHRRDAVGDARTGGEHGQAGPAGELGVGLGGERRRLLVAGVDDPHPLVAGGRRRTARRARR